MALECTGGEITLQEIIEDVNLNTTNVTSHIGNTSNPHGVTAAQIGAATGRNILIDGEVGRINQSVFDGDWVQIAENDYGYDIWGKNANETLWQGVEEGNYKPNSVYTLSGNNVTTAQFTSPASGTWYIGYDGVMIDTIPTTATNVQLELGTVATEFEVLPYNIQLLRVQRYYIDNGGNNLTGINVFSAPHLESNRIFPSIPFPTEMVSVPTVEIGTYSAGVGFITQYNNTSSKPAVTSVTGTTKVSLCTQINCETLDVDGIYLFNYSADARL